MGAKAVLFGIALMLMAFSACSPREQAGAAPTESTVSDTASITDVEAPKADVAAQPQTPTLADPNITMYVNATAGLRVRNIPSTKGESLGSLEHLTKVNVTIISNDIVAIGDTAGNWVYINRPIEGWVFSGFLETEQQRSLARISEYGRNIAREFLMRYRTLVTVKLLSSETRIIIPGGMRKKDPPPIVILL